MNPLQLPAGVELVVVGLNLLVPVVFVYVLYRLFWVHGADAFENDPEADVEVEESETE